MKLKCIKYLESKILENINMIVTYDEEETFEATVMIV